MMAHNILTQGCCEGSSWDTCALLTWKFSHLGEALRADQGKGGGGGGHQRTHSSPGQSHQGDEETGVWGARACKTKEEEKEGTKRTKSPLLQEKEEKVR